MKGEEGMKKMEWKKKIAIVLVLIISCSTNVVSALAGESFNNEVPYRTYTYDKWGNATPTPNGYLPHKSIRGTAIGVGDFLEPQDLFYSEARSEIYIVDTGNKRIIVTDKDFQLIKVIEELSWEGSPYQFIRPTGIYVTDEGIMYIADQDLKEILISDQDGNVLNKFGRPVSNLIDDSFDYKPNKVAVDDFGKIYVQASGVYQGLMYLKSDGTFVKFFGANKVEMTMKRVMQKIWKTILSDKASSNMQSFNPIEYGNVFMAGDGFIYTTAAASENNNKLIAKLNPLGVDIIPFNKTVWYQSATFTDVTVDEEETLTVVDAKTGRVYQSDKNGQLMFAFGGIGEQLGLFKRPTSIIEIDDKLYVLDSEKKDITEFVLTGFGETVRQAISLYNMGLYQESIKPWEDVIRLNANFLLAYTGVGKAYYQLEEFETAMNYYKLANDRANYSTAFKEHSLEVMRSNFGLIIASIIILSVGYKVGQYLWKRHKNKKGGRT